MKSYIFNIMLLSAAL